MNIKSVTPNLTSLDTIAKTDAKERVRFQESTDRDANGKQERESKEESHQFNDEDWAAAIEKLKNLPAVLKNNLQVIAIEDSEKKFVKILDLNGECIRRLSENDVWHSLENIDLEKPKGQLLNKAM